MNKNQGPKKEWARLYTNKSKESIEALKLLRKAGYRTISFPVKGMMGPELLLGRCTYRGLEDIKELIKKRSKNE